MRTLCLLWTLFLCLSVGAQKSDFSEIDFSKADNIAKRLRKEKLDIHKLSFKLTKDLDTEVEKFRAIYIWITHNIANDHRLFLKNNRKRNKYFQDSIALDQWNSKFKKIVFKKLLRKKKTICSGYAYLLQEMCDVVGIKAITIHGFGKTSDVDLEKLLFANHSWNAVRLNKKWYLCDPTWAAGITSSEKKRFTFSYNDGYFLTEPELFMMNHYPADPQWTLLGDDVLSFQEFSEAPLLYGDAYKWLSKHIAPKKMYHEVSRDTSINFQYALKESLHPKKIKFVFVSGNTETYKTPTMTLTDNRLELQQTFPSRGYYDLHLYFEDKLIASYTFKVIK